MTSNRFLTVTPAYGRDYKSKEAVAADWKDRKDFQIADLGCSYNGAYVGIGQSSEMKNEGWSGVKIRYDKLRKFVFLDFEGTVAKA